MTDLLVPIIVVGTVLLLVTMYMEWIGLLSLVTKQAPGRYAACGHIRAWPVSAGTGSCWNCRHPHVDHLVHHRTRH